MTGTVRGSGVGTGAATVPECPYVGLVPFTEDDVGFFFGRDAEARLIAANLRTARLTILYAASGVGKTSVLRAGLLPRLRRLATRADAAAEELDGWRGRGWLTVYVSDWAGDPVVAVASALGAATGGAPLPDLGVPAVRELLATSGAGGVHLVLDQFEEYLLYHPDEDEGDLAGALGAVLRSRDLPVHVLLSVREDALAGLDRFKGRLPGLFDNYLRLAHLTPEAARTAVEGPLERYAALVDEDRRVVAEPALVDDLLDEVRVGRVSVAGPAGQSVGAGARQDVETPFLQLVLTRLWAAERAAGSRVLRRETLRDLGGAHTIVQNHLDTVMNGLPGAEQDLAAAVFRHLVTASGTKIALAVADLADLLERSPADVLAVVERLATGDRRIVRPVPPPAGSTGPTRYEVFHDVLAGAVLAWRRRHEEQAARAASERRLRAERDEAEARARAARRSLLRTRLVVLVVAVALLLAAAGGIYARNEARTARQQAALAVATEQADRSPQASLDAAVAAWRTRPDADSTSAVLRAASAPRGSVVAGPQPADGGARVEAMLRPSGSPLVVTVGVGGQVRVLDGPRVVGGGRLPGMAAGIELPGVSPDGDRVAAVDATGRAGVLTLSTGATVDLGGAVPETRVRPLGGAAADRVLLTGPAVGATTRSADGRGTAAVLSPGAVLAEPVADGSTVVTAAGDGTLQAWDAVSGRERRSPAPADGTVQFLLPYGPTQVVALSRRDSGDEVLRTWDWAGGAVSAPVALPGRPTIIWNARADPGSGTVTVAADKTAAVVDMGAGTVVSSLGDQPEFVYDAAASPDGRWLATASAGGRVLVWSRRPSATPDRPTFQFLGHAGAVTALAWDETSRGLLSTGYVDGTTRHWDLPADQRFDGHRSWVVDLDLAPDGRRMLTASADGTAQVFAVDAPAGPPLAVVAPGAHVAAARFVPTDPGRAVLLQDYGGAPELWRLDTVPPSPAVTFDPLPGRFLRSIDVSPDGRTVAGSDDLGRVHLWDLTTGHLAGGPPVRPTPAGQDPGPVGGGVAFDPRGEFLAAAQGRMVTLWRRDAAGAYTIPQDLPVRDVLDVAISPSGDVLAAGTQDGHVVLWRRDGRPVLDRPLASEGSQQIGRLSVSADGRRVAVGDADGLVQVWDVPTGELLTASRHHGDAVNDAAFLSPDGSRIASAGDDATVALWDCEACRDPAAALAAADRAAAPGG